MGKRQNIFDIINSYRNPEEELYRIEELLHEKGGVYIQDDLFDFVTKGTPTSIIKYIDARLIKNWKARGTCTCTSHLLDELELRDIFDADEPIDNEQMLKYCEYVANMIYLLKQKLVPGDTLGDNADVILANLELLLGWYNHEIKYDPQKEKAIVVLKNASVTAAAEALNGELAYSVIEYNHHLLKGDIAKKKAILLALGNELEPKRKEIAKLNSKLEDDIFYMLNNLDIRHNNRKKGDKNYKQIVARMKFATLEKWYDELYQQMLLAILMLENVERTDKIEELREKINSANVEKS